MSRCEILSGEMSSRRITGGEISGGEIYFLNALKREKKKLLHCGFSPIGTKVFQKWLHFCQDFVHVCSVQQQFFWMNDASLLNTIVARFFSHALWLSTTIGANSKISFKKSIFLKISVLKYKSISILILTVLNIKILNIFGQKIPVCASPKRATRCIYNLEISKIFQIISYLSNVIVLTLITSELKYSILIRHRTNEDRKWYIEWNVLKKITGKKHLEENRKLVTFGHSEGADMNSEHFDEIQKWINIMKDLR